MTDDAAHPKATGRMRLPRSRGALSGVLLVLLGLWGALVPLVGPYFDFAFTPRPGTTWHWTAARGWYEVLPGGVAVLGGLLLLVSANRLLTSLGGWLGAVAGGWFVVAPQLSTQLKLGSIGSPAGNHLRKQTIEALTFFTGLGAVIVLVAGLAIGRLSVRAVRDVQAAVRRDEQAATQDDDDRGPSGDLAPAAAAPGAYDAAPTSQYGPGLQGTGFQEPGPQETGPQEPGPQEPGPQGTGPVATSGHQDAPYAPQGEVPAPATIPAGAESEPGGPAYPTQPDASQAPDASADPEPATSEPATSEPATSEPATSEPATSEPEQSEPERAQRNVPGGPQMPQRYVRGTGDTSA